MYAPTGPARRRDMVPEGKGGPRVAHGGDTRDGMRQMDGLTMGNLSCGYSCTTLNANDAQTEELSYEIGAVSADVAIGGVRVNIIPKEGGNTFSGSAFGNFSNSGLQGDNLSRELLDLGLRTPDVVDSIWDSSVELGGPLVRDRLWFHGAYRNWGLKLLPANTFYDRNPADYVFEPDESRPGVDEQYDDQSASLRLTWQATDQNKFALYYNGALRHRPYQGILAGPERRLLPGRERAGAVLERQLRAERHHELLRRRRHVGIRRPPQQLGVLAPGSSRRSCPGRPWTWRTGGACRATSR